MRPVAVGFTLVQVLVVLGILGILAAILVPGLFQVRQKAQQSACLSNLHQISRAMQMYVADWDGTYPPVLSSAIDASGHSSDDVRDWFSFIGPYLSDSHLACPDRVLPGEFVGFGSETSLIGYALNYQLNVFRATPTGHVNAGKPEPALQYPSLTVTVFDARAGVTAPDTLENWAASGKVYLSEYPAELKAQPPGAERHQGGANYAFGDGHTHWYRPSQLRKRAHSDGVHPGFGL